MATPMLTVTATGGWPGAGRTGVSAIARHLPPKRLHNSQIVQMNGAANEITSGIAYSGAILERFGQSFGAELSAENRRMMVVPKGFAHGFITLADDTEAFYFVDEFYAPELERGVRWDDPRFAISWPLAPVVLSDKDRGHRDFDPAWHLSS